MICTRCEGTGFINLHQIPCEQRTAMEGNLVAAVPVWIAEQTKPHDVSICDCCGDGSGWYGEPGQHYGGDDPKGDRGPYHNNGGLCQCH